MGQEASKPRPGTKLQVIGAGLPRTGTASFSAALSVLLDGPVYHGGTQMCLSDRGDIQKWTRAYQKTPIKSSGDREYIVKVCRETLSGFAATTDTPAAQFVPELMELFPEAKVICTVRDPDAWAKSMTQTASHALVWFLWIVLLPVPVMRHFPRYIEAIENGRWSELYHRPGHSIRDQRPVYDRHIEWLKSVVPEDKLIFFDVRDGWEPLCKALDLDIPEGIQFPKINDGESIEKFAQQQITRGLKAWAKIFSVLVAVGGVGYYAWVR